MITARGLERRFRRKGRAGGEVHAVKGVDLDVEAGELVGFLGPHGAAKTTTLRMLTTLLKPTAGTATVCGHDLLTDAAGVGGGTAPEARVDEELELQAVPDEQGRRDRARQGAHRAARPDRPRPAAHEDAVRGQRRRLDIALRLIHSPGLVFLDEPSNGLDPQSRANL